ncbi:cysteine-rich receptor-like protein kinase 40 [Lolium rigidum]|uniref:cysteine-rich receptor-like protein kinase 40 n=1 Tax=Lolium rigidum TaxID=89674 RepID=UPI001F5CE71C|nr:cysteine-rich receptor-like protein kinase 40 [Lolium rigidum]
MDADTRAKTPVGQIDGGLRIVVQMRARADEQGCRGSWAQCGSTTCRRPARPVPVVLGAGLLCTTGLLLFGELQKLEWMNGREQTRSSSMGKKVDHKSKQPCEFSHKQIKQITNNFDKALLLGSGGFGTVYKGIFENGREIAVKVLKFTSETDIKDFRKELENLRNFKHQNLVDLVGFCNESEQEVVEYDGKQVIAEKLHMALCLEFVPNGSLTKHISAECAGLNWPTRYKIIKGICDGLKHLRQGPEFLLWHLDLKPDNILLDNDMIPKIADFGLSRLLHDENTRKTINFRGSW